ncbi:MAG: 50S ribosomal protein L4 [Minisyncoccota bacterium]
MVQITVKNITGQKVKDMELKSFVFDVPANDILVHQIYVAQMGNARKAIAHTKGRGERTGSGIKPWRQKGTGRARAGALRSPLWRKGGITFGPNKHQNWSKDTNQKMRQKAVMIALSEKVRAGKFIVLDTLNYSEKKTKLFVETLRALGITNKSLSVCLTGGERALTVMSRNIPKVENIPTEMLSVVQLLDREYLVITEAGIQALESRFATWDKKNIQ